MGVTTSRVAALPILEPDGGLGTPPVE